MKDGSVRLRWSVPSRRRLVAVTVIAGCAAAVIYFNRGSLVALQKQFDYWRYTSHSPGDQSFHTHPASAALPARKWLMRSGIWANGEAKAALDRLRLEFPNEADEIDYYLAGWHFWNRNFPEAQALFQRLNRGNELTRVRDEWARTRSWEGDAAKVRALADDAAQPPRARFMALTELAQRADQARQSEQAAQYYLQALEFAYAPPYPSPVDREALAQVRRRVGHDITMEEYAAHLRLLAARVNSQQLLREIMFELGKLEMLGIKSSHVEVKG